MEKQIRSWLGVAVPLWLDSGVDWERGGFFESLELDGSGPSAGSSRRSMVQGRQIFSFEIALRLKIGPAERLREAIRLGADALIRDFSDASSGGFIHSVDASLKPLDRKLDLYAQSFCIFGLAHAFAVIPDEKYKARALQVVDYLERERRGPAGGFVEVGNKFESNPHMHLFEAALAWAEIDADPRWLKLAREMADLGARKFMDRETGLLAEFFDENWTPKRENGKFVFEPGHQYEWCWLFRRFSKLTREDSTEVQRKLFAPSERAGVGADRRMVYDQLWSDLTVKEKSSRFWPQGERVKAAAGLGDRKAADEAARALFEFLETKIPGLWYDTLEASGKMREQAAKGSSFYHIIGALFEYLDAKA